MTDKKVLLDQALKTMLDAMYVNKFSTNKSDLLEGGFDRLIAYLDEYGDVVTLHQDYYMLCDYTLYRFNDRDYFHLRLGSEGQMLVPFSNKDVMSTIIRKKEAISETESSSEELDQSTSEFWTFYILMKATWIVLKMEQTRLIVL